MIIAIRYSVRCDSVFHLYLRAKLHNLHFSSRQHLIGLGMEETVKHREKKRSQRVQDKRKKREGESESRSLDDRGYFKFICLHVYIKKSIGSEDAIE